MPELRPFRGLRYDPRSVPDLGAVICPPYDVIEPDERARLGRRDPRNAVHVELPGAESTQELVGAEVARGADPYASAAELFARWQVDGTLMRDDRPLIYPYEQRFLLDDGSTSVCRGFFCVLRLEVPGAGSSVRAHEHTRAAAREDRYQLLRAVRANLSPVLLLYEAAGGADAPAALLEALMSRPATQVATADDGVSNRLWAIDPDQAPDAAALLAAAAVGPLTIADGHHRYLTALRFRDEHGDGGADCVLAVLYEAGTSGLRIEPTHRVVRGVPELEALFAGLGESFDLAPQASAEAVLASLRGGGIGLWTRHGGARLPVAGDELDVAALAAAMTRIMGADAEGLEQRGALWYTRDAREAIESVDGGRADACFLLNPTPIGAVLDHAARGEVMPPKSTYFRPKAATGLVFNPLD